MGANKAILTLKLDTHEPVELRDFVGAFTSLANEFDRYVDREYPGITTQPEMFIREVRQGCIEADVITGLAIAAVGHMDQIIILEDFVRRWGARFTSLLKGRVPDGEIESASELKDWADAARSIASDPVGGHRLEAAYFENGNKDIKASFIFTASEARTALVNIEDRRKLLTKPEHLFHERVLLVFTRSDINDAAVGKSSGERVRIEELSEKSLALMYGSEVAEGTIKREIRDADENVYKKGFVVDVIVKVKNGKPVAYSVVTVHDVIDLPE
ncbi:hypothetical protein G6K96_08390 [Agrobacterium vitis]|nr:hypothetical protein [Agrobacterium vitis]NTA31731.1 hypothetical protein [Agrobacterium vitis]